MASRVTAGLRRAAMKIYRTPAVRDAVEQTLRRVRCRIRGADAYPTFGTFEHDDGTRTPLLRGLRDDVKPAWRSVMGPPAPHAIPARAAVLEKATTCRRNVDELVELVTASGFDVRGRRSLEVGCHDGLHAQILAEATGAEVVASDIARYYEVVDTTDGGTDSYLERLRAHCRDVLGPPPAGAGVVEFVEDDIARSTLQDGCVDLICSWEVLEHLVDPARSFAEMFRLLAPGGICFHEYNPFFAIDGGHSPCTLDFHWGHARVSDAELVRYVETLRPQEREAAIGFFRESLNRMTLVLLREHAERAGLLVRAIVPWPNHYHAELVEPETLSQVRAVHPTAQLLDLIAPKVWVVLAKP